jgi:hypothetical protein
MVIEKSLYNRIYSEASSALEVQSSLLLKLAASENRRRRLSGPKIQTEPFAEDFRANVMQALWATKQSETLQN